MLIYYPVRLSEKVLSIQARAEPFTSRKAKRGGEREEFRYARHRVLRYAIHPPRYLAKKKDLQSRRVQHQLNHPLTG